MPSHPTDSFAPCPDPIFSSAFPADAAPLSNSASRLPSAPGSDSLPAARPLRPLVVVDSVALDSTRGRDGEGYPLVAIVGPTAAGKSALGLWLAERLNGEIVNYDSVQVFRGFNVGTGKVLPAERRGVPHHLLDWVEPDRVFTAGDFAREATRVLASLRERSRLPILVGGTGLYLRALLQGLCAGPARSEPLRIRLAGLAHRRGREFLHRMLDRLDPPTAARVAPRDTQKTIRAIEVCILARQPLSALQARGRSGLQGFLPLKIGLNPERAELNRRIEARVERMFAAGLVEETRALAARLPSLRTEELSGPFTALGYRQALALLRGEINQAEALRKTQSATRQYAKRQRTWFLHESGVTWFAGFGDDPDVQRQILEGCERALQAARLSSSLPQALLHAEKGTSPSADGLKGKNYG